MRFLSSQPSSKYVYAAAVTVVLAAAGQALAGIAFDAQAQSSRQSGSLTHQFNHTTSGTNRCLVVAVHFMLAGSGDTGSVTSVTYDGAAMSEAVMKQGTGPFITGITYLYVLENPTAGTHQVSVTVSQSNGSSASQCVSLSYTGVMQTDAVEVTATSGLDTLDLTTLSDGAMVVEAHTLSPSDTNDRSPESGQSERYESFVSDTRIIGGDLLVPSAGPLTLDWFGGFGSAHAAIALQPWALLPTVTAIDPDSGFDLTPVSINSISGTNFVSTSLNTHSASLQRSALHHLAIADGAQTGLDVGGSFTAEAWVKLASNPDSNGSTYTIVSKWESGGSNQRGYIFRIANDGGTISLKLVLSPDGSSFAMAGVTATLPVGEWRHTAMVYNAGAGSTEFFVDGVSIGSVGGFAGSVFNNTTPFRIGAYTDGGSIIEVHDGSIDDVRLWSGVRSPSEIAANYQNELTGSEVNLLGYWRLNNNPLDSSPNGNDLTNSGSTFSTDVPFAGGSSAVKLVKSGESDIDCTGCAVQSDTSIVGGSFDITGAAPGAWDVVVTNPNGASAALDGGFTVLACDPPSISSQPSGLGVCLGDSATFEVEADGTAPLSYEWRLDGSPIVGGGASTLMIGSVQAADLGAYTVVVTNACGDATSDPATLAEDDADADSDGTPDCTDECPNDAAKTSPGDCGCGESEADADNDGTPDCHDVSRLLHFQGKLRDASGAAINGMADLTFRFYDTATGGNLLFTESHSSVAVSNGLLAALLGTQTIGGVPDAALERPEVYIGVEVGSSGELSPRSRAPATGYAIKSEAAEQLVKPGTLNPAVTVDATGQVGVGTASPGEALHVVGNILATGSITPGSSRALKHDITDVPTYEALAAIRALRPVKFRYNAEQSGETHVGFIAEDVPDLAATADRRGVDPMDIAAINTIVLKYQASLIERQGEALAQSECLIGELQAELQAMKWQLESLMKDRQR